MDDFTDRVPNIEMYLSDVMCREYSEMTTVRHVDFSDSDQPKNLKMSKQQQQQDPVRASPQLMTEVAH